MTDIRTGKSRKKKEKSKSHPSKPLFIPSKGKRTKKNLGRPKEGLLTSVEQWGQKKGLRPDTPYLAGALGNTDAY